MLFRYLAAIISVALVLAACGPVGPERKKCEEGCSATYQCPPGEPNPACEAALIECQDNCADGVTASAGLPLTPTLQARYMLADDNAPATAAAWQASWYRAGPTAWALPGAKGDGTDRTTIEATRTDGTGVPANGTAGTPLGNHIAKNDSQVPYYWDVTALLNDCPAAGMCVLALYMDAGTHINVLGGTTALEYFPAGPAPVCGDGAIAGSETCDDSNATAGDGCSALCAVEAGYGCSGAPSACATTCGDGVKAGAEECDNGAANGSNAPCSAACAAQACGCSPP